jgi:excisionase family DNA binding protein
MSDVDHSLLVTLREIIRPMMYEVVREVLRKELETRRPPVDEPEGYLSIKHAAQRLDIPEGTLRNWVKRGQIKPYRIQGCIRLKLSELVNAQGSK